MYDNDNSKRLKKNRNKWMENDRNKNEGPAHAWNKWWQRQNVKLSINFSALQIAAILSYWTKDKEIKMKYRLYNVFFLD